MCPPWQSRFSRPAGVLLPVWQVPVHCTSILDLGSFQEIGGTLPTTADHSYSGSSSTHSGPSSRRHHSRSVIQTLAPEMLDVQIQIRDAVTEMNECLNTNLPIIAKSLEETSKKYCGK